MNYPNFEIIEKDNPNPIKINKGNLVDIKFNEISHSHMDINTDDTMLGSIVNNHILKYHGFWLNSQYDWVIVKEKNDLFLIPTKKNNKTV